MNTIRLLAATAAAAALLTIPAGDGEARVASDSDTRFAPGVDGVVQPVGAVRQLGITSRRYSGAIYKTTRTRRHGQ